MSSTRLSAGHVVAALLAFALMFVMALDWYTTKQGEDFREVEENAGQFDRDEFQQAEEQARGRAEDEERNAWQEDGALDRILLVVLLATVAAAVGAAILRAAGRRFEPPLTPSLVAAVLALAGEALVAYRMFQEPGLDEATEVKAGVPLALACLALIGFASLRALRAEEQEPPADAEPEAA